MGRSLGFLQQELENLDKDADSRKNAMKVLKSHVKNLDSKSIPLFLASVSISKEQSSASGEHTISLYEVLARVHGRNIVPQIDNIMSTIINTLSSSAGSFPLHQSCAKVVPAIARYGIEPLTPQDEKTRIIGSLCNPLCDVLMGTTDALASGVALCLKALVESDNWRFASNETINELCLKLAGALEDKPTHTNPYMGLVMALSKHNSLMVEAYARSFLRSGLQVLSVGVAENNSQKRFSAIQMINFLMKCVDSRSFSSELRKVVEIMESCQADPMPFVKGAALEALQTAKAVVAQKHSAYDELCRTPDMSSTFSGKRTYGSPAWLLSPESHSIDSFMQNDSFLDSPLSIGQSSSSIERSKRANRKLWDHEKSQIDVSLKDGLFEGSRSGSNEFDSSEPSHAVKEPGNFSGFAESKSTRTGTCGCKQSPNRSHPQLTIDDVKIFTTPRKLVRSFQDSVDGTPRHFEKRDGMAPDPAASCGSKCNPATKENGDCHSHNVTCHAGGESNDMLLLNGHNKFGDKDIEHQSQSESVSSSGDIPTKTACMVSYEAHKVVKNEYQTVRSGRFGKAAMLVFGLFFFLFAVVVSVMRADGDVDLVYVVPT